MEERDHRRAERKGGKEGGKEGGSLFLGDLKPVSMSAISDEKEMSEEVPFSAWFVLCSVLTFGILVGNCFGWTLRGYMTSMKKKASRVRHQATETGPMIELVERRQAVSHPGSVYVAPMSGSHYHIRRGCGGLAPARKIRQLEACGTCVRAD